MKARDYLLIRSDVLPEVFRKVVEVKRRLDCGEASSINQAVKAVGLSRSAYYKYVDAVRVFAETKRGELATLMIRIENYAGVTMNVLKTLQRHACRVVAIHQNVAIKGIAVLLLTIDRADTPTSADDRSDDALLLDLKSVNGVVSVDAFV